jgi:predicted protein tyrosine phosphatase
MLHVLFVCSRNQWRSPTAERLFWKMPGLQVRSAGLRRSARRGLPDDDLGWADVVMVMEDHHADRIRQHFRDAVRGLNIEVLDIPDDYVFMDPQLCALLEDTVPPLLDVYTEGGS